MRWVHTVVILVPLLLGAAGSERRLGSNLPAVGETSPGDRLGADSGLDAPRGTVLAGKRAGMPFTKRGKVAVKKENAEKNDGENRCEDCDAETVPAQQHQKGVTPPKNEAQVDHVFPKAKGGDGDPDNGQVLCRDCNIKKGDKAP